MAVALVAIVVTLDAENAAAAIYIDFNTLAGTVEGLHFIVAVVTLDFEHPKAPFAESFADLGKRHVWSIGNRLRVRGQRDGGDEDGGGDGTGGGDHDGVFPSAEAETHPALS